MSKTAIAVHGGAGKDSAFIREHKQEYESALEKALLEGDIVLKMGRSAIEAVTAAVVYLENHPLFNAGKGSAMDREGRIEMDASIMDGKTMNAGAVALVRNVKNPVELAREIMLQTSHVMIAGYEATEFAKKVGLALEEDEYFETSHQKEELSRSKVQSDLTLLAQRKKGTVGAVALDINGNLAAATSTGGTSGSLPGRVGDSCIIGAGCFADNKTCAVSGTGDGEFLITGAIAHSISMAIEFKNILLQEACDLIIHERNKEVAGDMGVISINTKGEIGIAFNSERMHRAWRDASGNIFSKIYN